MKPHIRLNELFEFEAARSRGIDDYEPGDTPFVTSTLLNNGVSGYVTPLIGDKVFNGPAITLSGLGDATVQLNRFLPKGNGGDSHTVCKPKEPMSVDQLLKIATAFNVLHAWRFSYGRKCSITRIQNIEIPKDLPDISSTWSEEANSVERLAKQLMTEL